MKLKEILAQRRFKKALLTKFSATYKFITNMLHKKGFLMPNNPMDSPDCYRGKKGFFLCSEKIGPGIVGTLLCCSQCRGYKEIIDYFSKYKKLPEKIEVGCAIARENCDGLYRPVILYPMLKKPNNKPFIFDILHMKPIIEQWVLPKEKKK